MGTPITENEPSGSQHSCWLSGKPWFGFETPEVLLITFSGLVPTDFPVSGMTDRLNNSYYLTRQDPNVNRWALFFDGNVISVEWTGSFTEIFWSESGIGSYFNAVDSPSCQSSLVNDNANEFGKVAWKGIAILTQMKDFPV